MSSIVREFSCARRNIGDESQRPRRMMKSPRVGDTSPRLCIPVFNLTKIGTAADGEKYAPNYGGVNIANVPITEEQIWHAFKRDMSALCLPRRTYSWRSKVTKRKGKGGKGKKGC